MTINKCKLNQPVKKKSWIAETKSEPFMDNNSEESRDNMTAE
jgi:hypothetical protein